MCVKKKTGGKKTGKRRQRSQWVVVSEKQNPILKYKGEKNKQEREDRVLNGWGYL
jgi:hypothetical protein